MTTLTIPQKVLVAMAGLAIAVGQILDSRFAMQGWLSLMVRCVQIVSVLFLATLARRVL